MLVASFTITQIDHFFRPYPPYSYNDWKFLKFIYIYAFMWLKYFDVIFTFILETNILEIIISTQN
jgi:hypothetical protein